MDELDEQLWARFQSLRQRIHDYINDEVSSGTFHKSYEGRMEVSFWYPSVFHETSGEKPSVRITLWCYLICPGREYEWEADSFAEVLLKAERDIYRWTGK